MDILIPSKTQAGPIPDYIEGHRAIVAGVNTSDPVRRNYCLLKAESDIVVMVSENISGFYDGWVDDLVKPIQDDPYAVISSARLMFYYGFFIHDIHSDEDYHRIDGVRIPFGAVAFRRDNNLFSVDYESDYCCADFCHRLCAAYPNGYNVIANKCKLISHQFGGANIKDKMLLAEKWGAM
jgi:hypothetical protein